MAIQKDYEAIAGIIRQEYVSFEGTDKCNNEKQQAIARIALNMANYFETANSWFNKTQFLITCEFEE